MASKRLEINPHGNSLPDWCHLCGERKTQLADAHYAGNAEHDTGDERYVRICADCLERMLEVAR